MEETPETPVDEVASPAAPTTNVLNDAIRRVRDLNPALAATIEREVNALRDSRTFGLVFERHLPESVRLVGYPIKRGVQVALRHGPKGREHVAWKVLRLEGTGDTRVAYLLRPGLNGEAAVKEPEPVAVKDLVVVREFGEPVFPGLKRVGEPIRRDARPDAPNHLVINGENFHALQLLKMTHRKKVDLIYLDPPYNTGGKSSWLYNDDYVDRTDTSMSSKWLSFMARRLEVARELLKDTGVIMVSIGDDEQHRLRMLMDQTFGVKNCVAVLTVEMSTTSGPKTVNAQQGTIVKNSEFVLIYRRSAAFDSVPHTPLVDGVEGWAPNYTFWLHEDGRLGSLSEALLVQEDVRADIERFGWLTKAGFSLTRMDELLTVSPNTRAFVERNVARIARTDRLPVSCKGQNPPTGRYIHFEAESRDYILTRLPSGTEVQVIPLSMNYRWSDDHKPRYGRTVLRGDLWKGFFKDMARVDQEGGVQFNNGKKPIRLIKQLVRWANNAPDTVVVDFFGGSGTTAHAVMSMNAEDGGKRQSIVVTNNEVGIDVAKSLRKAGRWPGDPEWEARGVFESVTIPRVSTVATGLRVDGTRFDNAVPSNVDFYRLTYLDPDRVSGAREFEAIAPLLWMMAGSPADMIATEPEEGFAVTSAYAVLSDTDATEDFLKAIVAQPQPPALVFVVTDSPSEFEYISGLLPDASKPVRLYEEYLRNFLVNVEVA